MSTTTAVFSGNAAIPYAAINLRDPYYRDMARFVIDAAKARLDSKINFAIDLGAGIGISTMEMLKDSRYVTAVEPEEGMRYFLKLNVMGEPRATILEGKGEHLFSTIQHTLTDYQNSINVFADAVLCCQVFHLFNPPSDESQVPQVLSQIGKTLRKGGVLAFDLGPSNFEFATPISDHHIGSAKRGEIMTELSHPLYQRAHEIAFHFVKLNYPDFSRDNLWPPPAARMSFEFLEQECNKAALRDLRVSEEFYPLSGKRVIDFIRGAWAGRHYWMMNLVLRSLFSQKDFEEMSTVMSYHPTAVFTAVKE